MNKKNLGANTKYLPTGDLKQTISRLQASLHSVHYPKPLDLSEIIKGSPQAYLPVLDWILFGFSRPIAKSLCNDYGAAEARVGSDLRFCENCWRLFSECFSLYPALKVTQFLSDSGFVERKALLLIQLIDIVKRKHNEIVKDKKKKLLASQVSVVYGAEKIPNRRIPQQYFVEKAYEYDDESPYEINNETNNETNNEESNLPNIHKETRIENLSQQSTRTSEFKINPQDHGKLHSRTDHLERVQQSHLQNTNANNLENDYDEESIEDNENEDNYNDNKVLNQSKVNIEQNNANSQSIESKMNNNQTNEIIDFISSKFEQFEDRLKGICDTMDARMTILEGKINFIEDRLEEDRKSNIRIRKTAYDTSNIQSSKPISPYIDTVSSNQYQASQSNIKTNPDIQSKLAQSSKSNTENSQVSNYGVHISDPQRVDITTLDPEYHKEVPIDIKNLSINNSNLQDTNNRIDSLTSQSIITSAPHSTSQTYTRQVSSTLAQSNVPQNINLSQASLTDHETSSFINMMKHNLSMTEKFISERTYSNVNRTFE